ncbi:hexose transporter [Coprinopsis marcescibilis]|uniref:Hexose transporter n=1 Tax=Coprinopsis marcescibilis TaxID=230819 RepID=A0A5C3L671_COPMA|nr:hexose transporter [Coprinopsis marcescibilis]
MAGGDLPELQIADLIDQGRWWRNRGILMLNICLLIPLMTSIANGLDSSLVNGLQIIPAWKEHFGSPAEKTLGLIQSAQFLGNMAGLPFSPFVSDLFGRRAALFVGSIIMLAGVAVQSTSKSVGMLIGSRATIGFGLAFCANAAPLLLIELSYPTHRGKVTAMYNSCWYFGSILSAWVCFGAFEHAPNSHWSWRVPTIVQAFLPVVQVLSIWFIPESPRWLVSKGRESKAAQILAKYHANGGDERDPLVTFEMAQIRHALRLEERINKTTSYWSLFQTPGNRKRMRIIIAIAVFSQWSGNGLVSYYIDLVLTGIGITSPRTKTAINGGLQVFNFFIAMGAAMLIDWVGRRTLFITSNAGMLVSFWVWTLSVALYKTKNITDAAKATVPFIFLFFFFYDLAYTPLLVSYCLEILPFRIRAKGFAVMNFTIMATVAFNQFVNPWALAAIDWWYYIVYCGWLVIELGFIMAFIVETRGRTLEETAALFDGDDQTYELVKAAGTAASTSMRARQVDDEEPFPIRRKRPTSTGEAFELGDKRRSDSTGSTTRQDTFLAI